MKVLVFSLCSIDWKCIAFFFFSLLASIRLTERQLSNVNHTKWVVGLCWMIFKMKQKWTICMNQNQTNWKENIFKTNKFDKLCDVILFSRKNSTKIRLETDVTISNHTSSSSSSFLFCDTRSYCAHWMVVCIEFRKKTVKYLGACKWREHGMA